MHQLYQSLRNQVITLHLLQSIIRRQPSVIVKLIEWETFLAIINTKCQRNHQFTNDINSDEGVNINSFSIHISCSFFFFLVFCSVDFALYVAILFYIVKMLHLDIIYRWFWPFNRLYVDFRWIGLPFGTVNTK